MTDASAIRRPSSPRTRSCGSTTDASSDPMRHVPAGWYSVCERARRCARNCSSVRARRRGGSLRRRTTRAAPARGPARKTQPAKERRLVLPVGVGEVAGVDRRRLARVGRPEQDGPSASRREQDDGQRQAVLARRLEALLLEQHRREEKLDVGRTRPGRERTKATASPRLEVRGPRPRSAQRTRLGSDSAEASVSTPLVRTRRPLARWSRRFAPTAGLSRTTSTPAASSGSRGPIPESWRRCGVPIAPAQRTTSRAQRASPTRRPRCAARPRPHDRPRPGPHGEGVRDHGEVRPSLGRREVAVENAEPPAAALRDGHEADTVVLLAVEVLRQRNAHGLRGVDERLREHVAIGKLGERERAARAPRERGLDVVPRPARAPGSGPAVVVGVVPRSTIIAFIAAEPPSMRPRGKTTSRPSSAGCGVVTSPQSTALR